MKKSICAVTWYSVVVVNHGDKSASVLLGNGNATFQTEQNELFITYVYPLFITTEDFNSDHILDLAISTEGYLGNRIYIFLGNGDGTFQKTNPYDVGDTPTSIAVVVFNDDGQLVLVVANFNDSILSIFFGYGNGTFQNQQLYKLDSHPSFVATGHLNHDNALDLVVANSADDTISLLFGNGEGMFSDQKKYRNVHVPNCVTIGDFNNDFNLDIVVGNGWDTNVR